ncbi:MAG: 1-acyl-sn-glycerol-3-phosphate acyltransferase [Clostridia bacterium]|nr:1-acyl-sn-glycerol-3-phosphate acyltransferase [Clostridia bacterium]
MKKILKKIVETVLYLYYKIVYRMKVVGTENIPKEQVIFCGNHRSFLDPPAIRITCKKDAKFLAKEDLAKNKFLAFLGWLFEVVYVKRDAKDITALKNTLSLLKKGESIALFPEGTRNGMAKGEDVKDGAAFFAIKSGVKVVPVGIGGDLKPFHKLTVTYGKPLDFSKYTNPKDKEQVEEVTNTIMEEIKKLI